VSARVARRELGLAPRALSAAMEGRHYPPDGLVVWLWREHGIAPLWLLHGEGPMMAGAGAEEPVEATIASQPPSASRPPHVLVYVTLDAFRQLAELDIGAATRLVDVLGRELARARPRGGTRRHRRGEPQNA
jgi:hypothetical protein